MLRLDYYRPKFDATAKIEFEKTPNINFPPNKDVWLLDRLERYLISPQRIKELPPKDALNALISLQILCPKKLNGALYKLLLEILTAEIPAAQESLLVKLIYVTPLEQRHTLFAVCSKLNFECGDELYLAAVEELSDDNYQECLDQYARLRQMPAAERYNQTPAVVLKAQDKELKLDPIGAFDRSTDKTPTLYRQVARALYNKYEYDKALPFALEYANSSADDNDRKCRMLRALAAKCTPTQEFLEPLLTRGFNGNITAAELSTLVELIQRAPKKQRLALYIACSKLNFECGDELYLAAVEEFSADNYRLCLDQYAQLREMSAAAHYNQIPAAVLKAQGKELEEEPIAAFERSTNKTPTLYRQVARALYDKGEYDKALPFALEYANSSADDNDRKYRMLRALASRCTPAKELFEHPLIKDDKDLLPQRAALSENPQRYLSALLAHDNGTSEALRIIENFPLTEFQVDLNEAIRFCFAQNRVDLVIKILKSRPDWIPSQTLLPQIVDVVDEDIAKILYRSCGPELQEKVARRFTQNDPNLWVPRLSHFENLDADTLLLMNVQSPHQAHNVYQKLKGTDTKMRWATLIYSQNRILALTMIDKGVHIAINESILDLAKEGEYAPLAWKVYRKQHPMKPEFTGIYTFYSTIMATDEYSTFLHGMFTCRQKVFFKTQLIESLRGPSDANTIYKKLPCESMKTEWAIDVYNHNPLFTILFFEKALLGCSFPVKVLHASLESSTKKEKLLVWRIYCNKGLFYPEHLNTYWQFVNCMSKDDIQVIIDSIDLATLDPKYCNALALIIGQANASETRLSFTLPSTNIENVHAVLSSIFTYHCLYSDEDSFVRAHEVYLTIKESKTNFPARPHILKAMKSILMKRGLAIKLSALGKALTPDCDPNPLDEIRVLKKSRE